MKNYGGLLTMLGLVVLALGFIVKRYLEVSDFIYGVSHGISIAFLLMGIIFNRIATSESRKAKWSMLKDMMK